jgi:hypothetical protein
LSGAFRAVVLNSEAGLSDNPRASQTIFSAWPALTSRRHRCKRLREMTGAVDLELRQRLGVQFLQAHDAHGARRNGQFNGEALIQSASH